MIIAVADPAALAQPPRERLLARIAANQRPRRDLPDRRIEPETALSTAGDRALSKPDSVAARALVHRRRALRAAGRPTQQHGHGAARRFSIACAPAAQHPPDPDRSPPIPTKRAALRARTEIVLRRRRARSRPAAVRSRADGRRARTAIPPRCFRAIRRWTRPSAGSSACPRRMSSPSCRGSR